MAGLVTSLGSGAMTNPITDLSLSDCILVIGSNFAENHPIISRYVLDAKEQGATLIVADPRFTPTAWQADIFLQLLPGTDITLLNGLMNIILSEGIHKQDFIANRTTGFEDLKKGLKKYKPERVARETGVGAADMIAAARAYASARAASIVYCMGVTQHTCGTDTVINCANLALMCGQIGRPGTGVNPLRGQDNVQGACDMGALVSVYPGYQSVADEAVRTSFARTWGTTADLLPAQPGKTVVEMSHAAVKGDLKGMLIMGENPVVGARSADTGFVPGRSDAVVIHDTAYIFSPYYASFLNGIPSNCNKTRAWSSFFAVVTIVTSIPRNLSILSYSISGKIN